MRFIGAFAFLVAIALVSGIAWAQTEGDVWDGPPLPYFPFFDSFDSINPTNISYASPFLVCGRITQDCVPGSVSGTYNYTYYINATDKRSVSGSIVPYNSVASTLGLETTSATERFWCTPYTVDNRPPMLVANGTNSTQDGLSVRSFELNMTARCTVQLVGDIIESEYGLYSVGSLFVDFEETETENRFLFGNFTGGTITIKPYEKLSLVNLSNGTAWNPRFEPLSRDDALLHGYVIKYSNLSVTNLVPSPFVEVLKPAGEEWKAVFTIPANAPTGILTFRVTNGTYSGAVFRRYAAIPLRVNITAQGQSRISVSQGGIAQILLNVTNDYSNVTSISVNISNLAAFGVNTTANITYPNGTVQAVNVSVGVGAQTGKILELGGLKDKAGEYLYRINLTVPFRGGDYFINATIGHATGYVALPSMVVTAIPYSLDVSLLDSRRLPRDAYGRGETVFVEAAVQDKSVTPPQAVDADVNFTITSSNLTAFPQKVFKAEDAAIEAGIYKINLTLPVDAPLGPWNLTVHGSDDFGNSYFFSKNFSVGVPTLGLALEPTSLRFDVTSLASKSALVNVTNIGGTLTNVVLNVSQDLRDFVIASNASIPLPFETGTKSNITITVTPTDALPDGITSGTLTLIANGAQQTLPISLNVSLVAAMDVDSVVSRTVVLTESSIDFAIKNIGSRNLTNIVVAIIEDRDMIIDALLKPDSIVAGGSGLVTVRFKSPLPTTGRFTARLNLSAEKVPSREVTLDIEVINDFGTDLQDLDRELALLEANLVPFQTRGINLGGLDAELVQIRELLSDAQSKYRDQAYDEAKILLDETRTRFARAKLELEAMAAQSGITLGKDLGEIQQNTRTAQAQASGGAFILIIVIVVAAVVGVVLFLSLVPIAESPRPARSAPRLLRRRE